MSARARFIIAVVFGAMVLLTWRFTSRPVAVQSVQARPTASPPDKNRQPPDGNSDVSNLHGPVAPLTVIGAPSRSGSASSQSDKPTDDREALNERTLVGTKWEREGFGIEFGADGKLLIAGRERAKWQIAGGRIRLYRDATGEEHWLDIVGNTLKWEGREIGRVR